MIFSKNVVCCIFDSKCDDVPRTKLSMLGCAIVGCVIALSTTSSVHSLIESSGKVTMVMAFAPLVFGLFWKKSSSKGALSALLGGGFAWIMLELYRPFVDIAFLNAPEIVGLITAISLMVLVSIMMPDRKSRIFS